MSADISGPSSGPEPDPAARRAEVLDAARDIAARFELGEVEPEVLYDLFSVVVHLRPTPVVLRVPTVLPRGFADDLSRRERRQADELAVAAWLVDRGFPTRRPSALLPQRPLRSGRWTATAWEYVKHYEPAEAAVAELADQIVPMVIRLHIELESVFRAAAVPGVLGRHPGRSHHGTGRSTRSAPGFGHGTAAPRAHRAERGPGFRGGVPRPVHGGRGPGDPR